MMSANPFYTYGPQELCVWKVAPGRFWFQTTAPEYSRKLDQRRDTRRVGITGVKHPSFSIFHSSQGEGWKWKCFAGCGEGDEISFLRKLKGLSAPKAMNLYLDLAGFPASRPSKSHEYPKCPESPVSLAYPVSPVSPVSEGQGLEEELKRLAMANACTRAEDAAETKRFKLARDLAGLEGEIAR